MVRSGNGIGRQVGNVGSIVSRREQQSLKVQNCRDLNNAVEVHPGTVLQHGDEHSRPRRSVAFTHQELG